MSQILTNIKYIGKQQQQVIALLNWYFETFNEQTLQN